MFWRSLSALSLIAFLAACEGSTPIHEMTKIPSAQAPLTQKPVAPTPAPLPEEDVYYAQVKTVCFDQYCVTCHHEGKRKPYLETFEQVKARLSDIKERVFDSVGTDEQMPPKNYPKQPSEEDKAFLKKWLEAGAPEGPGSQPPATTPTPTPTPTPEPQPDHPPVSWTQVAPIFQNKCVKCHNAGASMMNAYETVAQVRKSATRINKLVQRGVMPAAPENWPKDQPNPNQLPQEEKDLIAKWISDGMAD